MISDSSEHDSSSDRAPLTFTRTRRRDVIVFSISDSDNMFVSSRRTSPRIVDVGPTSVGVVSVGPACDDVTSDGAFGSTFDVGPIVPDPVDDVLDSAADDVGSGGPSRWDPQRWAHLGVP